MDLDDDEVPVVDYDSPEPVYQSLASPARISSPPRKRSSRKKKKAPKQVPPLQHVLQQQHHHHHHPSKPATPVVKQSATPPLTAAQSLPSVGPLSNTGGTGDGSATITGSAGDGKPVPPIFNMMGSLVGHARTMWNSSVSPTRQNQHADMAQNVPLPQNMSQNMPQNLPPNMSLPQNRPVQHLNNLHTQSMSMSAIPTYHGTKTPSPTHTGPQFSQFQSEPASRKQSVATEVFTPTTKTPSTSTMWTLLVTDASVAVYIALILAGVLVAQYRDVIELMLHDGIGLMFMAITALSSVGAIAVTLYLAYRAIRKWYKANSMSGQLPVPPQLATMPPGLQQQQQQQGVQQPGLQPVQGLGLGQPGLAGLQGMTSGPAGLPTGVETDLADAFAQAPAPDHQFSYVTSFDQPPAEQFHDQGFRASRSLSHPVLPQILQPTPVYGMSASFGPGYHAPLPTAPIHDFNNGSYFSRQLEMNTPKPQFGSAVAAAAANGLANIQKPQPQTQPQSRPLSRAAESQPQSTQSQTVQPTPALSQPQSRLQSHASTHFIPEFTPEFKPDFTPDVRADFRVPFGRMSPTPTERDSEDQLAMPPLLDASPNTPEETSPARMPSLKIKRGPFINKGKPAMFTRQENDLPNPDILPTLPEYYTDVDSCKPYGAPPRRYRGVNV